MLAAYGAAALLEPLDHFTYVGLQQNLERVELRKSIALARAFEAASGAAMGPEWFDAMSYEESQAGVLSLETFVSRQHEAAKARCWGAR